MNHLGSPASLSSASSWTETKIELTGFVIPQGETLWVLPGVIHTNSYLKGTWNTMLNLEEDIETVKLMRDSQSISLSKENRSSMAAP